MDLAPAAPGIEAPPVPLPPQELRFMGEDDQRLIWMGQHLAGVLRERGLEEDADLLDVGSAYGRLPIGLLSTGFAGRYSGFDILPRHVKWCRKNLTPLAPDQYRFKHLDIFNSRYNPNGTKTAHEIRFPASGSSQDMLSVFSIFTHMYEADIRNYLAQIRRVLRPDGRAVTTWFLFTDDRLAAVTDRALARFPMTHVINAVTRYNEPQDPLRAIAYALDHVSLMVAEAGLEIVALERGTWCSDPGPEFQDILILRRPVPSRPHPLSRIARRVRPAVSRSLASEKIRKALVPLTRPSDPRPHGQPPGPSRSLPRSDDRQRSGRSRAADDLIADALSSTTRQARRGLATPREQDAVASAFAALWQPRSQPVDPPPDAVLDVIRDQFHLLYYHVSMQTWKDTWYRGIATYKCPTDMWVYQELIDDLRPGLVIETGTFRGGSALFLADRLETLGHGEVVTIDVDVQPDRPEHARLTYLTGSSVAPDIVEEVKRRLPTDGSPVLVTLDSDHSQHHVAAELRTYAPLVTIGSYLVVEDTNVNGHPAARDHGPGPYEAVADFLVAEPGYAVDPRCERYFLTQNPSGYLRRIS